MHTSKTFSSIVCASFISTTSFVTANTISPDIPNAAFAPVTILPSHPQCDGPGEVAFHVDFERNDLRFRLNVDDDTTFLSESMADGTKPSDPICTRTERRGTDVVRIHVDCDDAQVPIASAFAFLAPDEAGVAVTVEGTFTACQSPTSFDVLESAWTATVIQTGEATKFSGSFITHPKAGCEATKIHTNPSATLAYSTSGTSDVFGNWRSRYRYWDRPRLRQQVPAFFRVRLQNIPLESATQTESRFVANTWAIFFPTYDGKSACLDGLCQLPSSVVSGRRTTPLPVRVCR